MCLALYLFTNIKLPESQWSDDNPDVYIQPVINGTERGALKWLTKEKYVYYIGSSEGCGCGWRQTNSWDEVDEISQKKHDRQELLKIFKKIDFKHSWFVICWEGEQGKDFFEERYITNLDIADNTFEFEELIKYKIS